MPKLILPVSKGLYLCDYVFGYENEKSDLYGLFDTINAPEYPHTQKRFCVFAQLANGLGRIPFFISIRDLDKDSLVYTTETKLFHFPDRLTIVQMAYEIRECSFEKPGVYSVELYCDNAWVCDSILRLK